MQDYKDIHKCLEIAEESFVQVNDLFDADMFNHMLYFSHRATVNYLRILLTQRNMDVFQSEVLEDLISKLNVSGIEVDEEVSEILNKIVDYMSAWRDPVFKADAILGSEVRNSLIIVKRFFDNNFKNRMSFFLK